MTIEENNVYEVRMGPARVVCGEQKKKPTFWSKGLTVPDSGHTDHTAALTASFDGNPT